MKKYSLAFSLLFLSIVVAVFSCKKINEATELGGDLIPAVDNVHTFEVSLDAVTRNLQFNDSTQLTYNDLVVLGDLNDPEFGQTHADLSFNIIPSTLGTYPFGDKDSVQIDSVILSLSYQEAYGDTLGNGVQTIHVFEIDQNAGFRDDTVYRFADPASDFTNSTTGTELGSATYTVRNLKDSFNIVEAPNDTTRVANIVRVKLDNSLGERFASYDTSSSALTGGYYSDSTSGGIFRKLFPGFAIKADAGSNTLSYFNLGDISKTKLTVYFRNGTKDTSSFDFYHTTNGQANYVKQTPGAQWAASLNNPASDKLYLQTSPSGSYVSIKIPGLDTFSNKIIYRAELLATRIPSAADNLFTPPARLFLDKTNVGTPDTASVLHNDLSLSADGSIGFDVFGGDLHTDNTYRFNITRHVQGIITRHEPNDTLRLYAPMRTTVFAASLPSANSPTGTFVQLPVLGRIAGGRVVLGSGIYSDPSMRLRLRIIYSNL